MVENNPVENIFIKKRSNLIRYAAKFVSQDTAEDIVQDAYVKVARRHADQPITSPTAFTSRTVYNSAIDHLRRDAYRRSTSLEQTLDPTDNSLSLIDTIADPDYSPEDRAIQNETFFQLIDAIGELPVKQRNAVTYFYLKGFSYPESAAAMDIPVATFKINLFRAIEKLRKNPNLIRMITE